MKAMRYAGLAGLAALGAQAQGIPYGLPNPPTLESMVVTATRGLQPLPTLRDTVVITRAELEDAGTLSLGEVLERRAGVELRATGGPGQPESIFIRGAGSAATLVLIDGLRAGSSTAGTTAIEALPIDMIERIEVVKGPMSSLYGSEAVGGVIQVFTRNKKVPNFFANAGYGTDKDRAGSAGIATVEGDTSFSLAAGARKVDSPSATNPRAGLSYDPDRDPHENAFGTMHVAHKVWTGETIALDAFVSRSRTDFDAGIPPPGTPPDRNDQTVEGVRFSSSTHFASWWASKLAVGEGRDKETFTGQFPSTVETRQDQVSWVNEFPIAYGSVIAGYEGLRETVKPTHGTDPATGGDVVLYSQDRRTTNSIFAAISERAVGQSLDASIRRDSESQFGDRNTGSLSYGFDWVGVARFSGTWARGFRAPTFNDLYAASIPGFFHPNPDLQPETSKSSEISMERLPSKSAFKWKVTAFDNRLDNLIVFSPADQTVENVARARIRGIEARIDAAWLGVRWRAQVTGQDPKDDDTGKRLQGRAKLYGSLDGSRRFGKWSVGGTVFASGDRFDSIDENPASRLPGYAVLDAHVKYTFDKQWSAELTATNLLDKHYEGAVGYDAPRRGVFFAVHFDAY
jgi:vitamin B12 transporter